MSLLACFQKTNIRVYRIPIVLCPNGCIEATNNQVTELVLIKTNEGGLYKKDAPEEKTSVAL